MASNALCLHCNIIVLEHEEAIMCDCCKRWKHAACFQPGDGDYEEATKKIFWVCSKFCKENMKVDKKLFFVKSEDATLANLISLMKLCFTGSMEVKNFSIKQQTEMNDMKAKVNIMEDKVVNLQEEVSELKKEIVQLKQYNLSKKAICFDVKPKTKKRKDIIDTLDKYIKINSDDKIDLSSIKHCYMASKESDNKKPVTILEFQSSYDKNNFLYIIKKIKREKFGPNNTNCISTYEMVPPETRQLLVEAKHCLESQYKSFWTKNGRVFIQKEKPKDSSKQEPPIQINDISDIKRLMDQNRDEISTLDESNSMDTLLS